MSYGYPGAPGHYGQAAGYGAAPGAPGMAPPGMNGNHNYDQGASANRQGGFPPNMKPPQNMPNFNFNAPVIRLGTSGPVSNAPSGGRGRDNNTEPSVHRRGGLGLDRGGDRQPRENFNVAPPTREEIFRTIFVGNIPDGVGGDPGMERLLRCAGHLRRWTRATDADNKPCKFGFAEFEDAESLETAAEVFKDIQVPLKKISPGAAKEDGDAEVEKATLLFVVDTASQKYAEEWREKRNEDETTVQFRLDTARESLKEVLASFFNPSAVVQDTDGDIAMNDVEQDPLTGEFIAINSAEPEDELSEIPVEMRETVAAEIAAFRDRSIRRDIERQKKEEEEERERKERNRLDMGTPSGPGRGANGFPLGPSATSGVPGAPSGPKGPRGYQMPKDYQNDRDFVRASDSVRYSYISKEEEDSDASDDELEARRQSKKAAVDDKAYEEAKRNWSVRERNRINAIEREQRRTEEEEKGVAKAKEDMNTKLKGWNTEERSKTELYYTDHSEWLRRRQALLAREQQTDDIDRRNEAEETERKRDREAKANGAADAFLDRQAKELQEKEAAVPRASLKINFGAAAQQQKNTTAGASKRRTAFEVEGLLDNQDDTLTSKKLTLKPINPNTLAEAAALTPEERQEAARQLAADIPSDKEGLWNWNVHWSSVTEEIIHDQLKPFVEKKIIEYLGVQEDMLVEAVEQHVRAKKGPQELVEELEGALDEDAETLVRKLWRMLVFYSESERRGLGA